VNAKGAEPIGQAVPKLGILTGLVVEAELARQLGFVVSGGGTTEGARKAALHLVKHGARALLSFGFAGGLDPTLRPGDVLVPRLVLGADREFSADPNLLEWLGGANVARLLGDGNVVADAAQKRKLWQQTGAAAIDLESGALAEVAAQHSLPFAVLRAVCDPAERSLPPVALTALGEKGEIDIVRLISGLFRKPSQLPALVALARDAQAARRALIGGVRELRLRPLIL